MIMELNLKKFNKQQLEEYYSFLDLIIERFGLQEGDERLVFNVNKEGQIVFTIGQRYVWITGANEEGFKFEVISEKPISNKSSDFDGKPTAFWNKFDDISEVLKHQQSIFNAIEKELNRAQKSSYFKHNKEELEKMAFDADFRKEVLDQSENQINIDELIKNINELMSNTDKTPATPLNQILFGAPGTGKTYHTKKIAVEIIKKNGKVSIEEIINGKKEKDRSREEINKEYEELIKAGQIVFTTFHQSLSYEDFIEGIKPKITEGGNVAYEVKDGIFKQLCSRAIEQKPKNSDIEIYDFDKGWNDLIAEVEQNLLSDSMLLLPILTQDKGVYVTEITDNGNLKIKPKNSRLDIDYIVSYNRTKKLQEAFPDLSVVHNIDKEFRSVIGGSNSSAYWAVLNYINNKIKENNKEIDFEETKNHVFIIDEINRGNVSAIFGELITLLEEDKRKGNPEHTEAVLPYSGDNFSVPNNVYIIGTMNTADRSVEALDTALRRRFSFVEMQPNPEILSEVEGVELSKLLETINRRIELLIDKYHQIGHSYFIGIENLDGLKRTFKDKIIPLLEEYFYGDFGKVGLVLGEKFIKQTKYEEKVFAEFPYEKDFLEDKKIYHITSSESWKVDAFKSIYGEVGNAK